MKTLTHRINVFKGNKFIEEVERIPVKLGGLSYYRYKGWLYFGWFNINAQTTYIDLLQARANGHETLKVIGFRYKLAGSTK